MRDKPAKPVPGKQMQPIERRWIERSRDLSQGFVDPNPEPDCHEKAESASHACGSAMLERWQAETMYDQPYNNLKAVAALGEKHDDRIKSENGTDYVPVTQTMSRL
jgi:hypothetical protein